MFVAVAASIVLGVTRTSLSKHAFVGLDEIEESFVGHDLHAIQHFALDSVVALAAEETDRRQLFIELQSPTPWVPLRRQRCGSLGLFLEELQELIVFETQDDFEHLSIAQVAKSVDADRGFFTTRALSGLVCSRLLTTERWML